MAQVLKQQVRQRIIDAAKNELLNKGIRDSSMRDIAKLSGVTVGNLYRYFKSKDELVNYILQAPLEQLDQKIKDITLNRVTLAKNQESFDFTYEEFELIYRDVLSSFFDIFKTYQQEFRILIKNNELSSRFENWFASLILSLIKQMFPDFNLSEIQLEQLAKMYSISIFSGIQFCLLDERFTEEKMKQMIMIYLDGYKQILKYNLDSRGKEK